MDVLIGIDPHKHSHTAVALDAADNVLGELRVDADRDQVRRLLLFAQSWPQRRWAVENANGWGRLVSRQLVTAGETVVDVPAKLSARVRALSGAGHKTDSHDARSTAVAGRHVKALRLVTVDDMTVLLAVLLERRWQLVSQRQKTLCRIHDQLVALLPGGSRRGLSATKTAQLLRSLRPTEPVARLRRDIVRDLLGELRVVDRKIKAVNEQLDQALDDYGTTLTDIVGIGRVGAATIIAIVGDPTRFANQSRFASFNGAAPIAASSGDKIRYRFNPGGQRQLNKVLHTAAKTQQRIAGPGRDYYLRRVAEGKRRMEATRALKRHISNAVYRTLLRDEQQRQEVARGGQRETTL